MGTVIILHKYFEEGWFVFADIETDIQKVVGLHFVALPETAADNEITQAILEQYQV